MAFVFLQVKFAEINWDSLQAIFFTILIFFMGFCLIQFVGILFEFCICDFSGMDKNVVRTEMA